MKNVNNETKVHIKEAISGFLDLYKAGEMHADGSRCINVGHFTIDVESLEWEKQALPLMPL